MNKWFLALAFVCMPALLFAQKDSADLLVAYRIVTIQALNDTTDVIGVEQAYDLPYKIRDKQLAFVLHGYKQGIELDTATIGIGKCRLFKGNYAYFSIHNYPGQRATKDDILYTRVRTPLKYDGLLVKIMTRGIMLKDVSDNPFLVYADVFRNDQDEENRLLGVMVDDITYTAKAMKEQMPASNQLMDDGLYKGKRLFDAMQVVTRKDLETFLKYVIARPAKYANNSWKISEIFATWMVGGTPHVIE